MNECTNVQKYIGEVPISTVNVFERSKEDQILKLNCLGIDERTQADRQTDGQTLPSTLPSSFPLYKNTQINDTWAHFNTGIFINFITFIGQIIQTGERTQADRQTDRHY